MSCNYYFYCPKCKESSDKIGENNPLECAKFLRFFYMYNHAVYLLDKCLGSSPNYQIESCSIRVNAARDFFKIHKYCLEERDYLMLNEWGEVSNPYLVKSDFGNGGKYAKR